MKQKLPHIYFLQTFGIILVVLGHSFYRISSDNLFIKWVYGFHMPLFFFISGYLLRDVHPDISSMKLWRNNGYMMRKIRRLLLPYFVISSLMFVPKALMSNYTVWHINLDWCSYIDMLVYPYHNVFGAYWFMPTLLLIFFVFIGIVLAAERWHLHIDIRIVLIACMVINISINFHHESLLNILGVAYFMVYFVLGYVFRKYNYKKYLNHLSPFITFFITFILSIILLYTPYFRSIELLTAINGIMLSMTLEAIYKRYRCNFLNHLYGFTYFIYLYSGFFQILSLQILLHFVPLPPYVYIPFAFLTGLYGPWCIGKWRHARQQ